MCTKKRLTFPGILYLMAEDGAVLRASMTCKR